MVARGPYFLQRARQILTPEQYEVFLGGAYGNYYLVSRIPRYIYEGKFMNNLPAEMLAEARTKALAVFYRVNKLNRNDASAMHRAANEVRDPQIEAELPPTVTRIRHDIWYALSEVLKRTGIEEFTAYYDYLSQIEKDAIIAIVPEFHDAMTRCDRATMCVYIWASVLMDLLNKIEAALGFPLTQLDRREHED